MRRWQAGAAACLLVPLASGWTSTDSSARRYLDRAIEHSTEARYAHIIVKAGRLSSTADYAKPDRFRLVTHVPDSADVVTTGDRRPATRVPIPSSS